MDPTEKEMATAVAGDVRFAMVAIASLVDTSGVSNFAAELAMVLLLARAADRRGQPRGEAWDLFRQAFMDAPVVPKGLVR